MHTPGRLTNNFLIHTRQVTTAHHSDSPERSTQSCRSKRESRRKTDRSSGAARKAFATAAGCIRWDPPPHPCHRPRPHPALRRRNSRGWARASMRTKPSETRFHEEEGDSETARRDTMQEQLPSSRLRVLGCLRKQDFAYPWHLKAEDSSAGYTQLDGQALTLGGMTRTRVAKRKTGHKRIPWLSLLSPCKRHRHQAPRATGACLPPRIPRWGRSLVTLSPPPVCHHNVGH